MNKSLIKILFAFTLLIVGFSAKQAFANTCVFQTTGNWTTAGTWTGCGGVAPTAADDVLVGTGSGGSTTGTLTIDSGAVARSADFTSFTGTVSQGAINWQLGDGTAGAGNVALNMPSGFTYAPNAASTITFKSTSATQQTIVITGYTTGNITFNSASAGDYAIGGNLSIGGTLTMSKVSHLHFAGAADTGGYTHTVNLVTTSNNGSVTVWDMGNATLSFTNVNTNALVMFNDPVTMNAGTSNFNFTGATENVSISPSGLTFYNFTFSGASTFGVPSVNLGGNTFNNLTFAGTAVKTDAFNLASNATVNGALTITGNSATNRLFLKSDTFNTQRTITLGGSAIWKTSANNKNFDMRDMKVTGGAANELDVSGVTGKSGDCGGNDVGITFTTPETQTSTGTANITWSTHGWTSRVPLCQDDVVMANAFTSGRAIAWDMPRLGKSIDMSGITWTGTATNLSSSIAETIYGSLAWKTGMTVASTNAVTFEGRGSFTLTSAGNSFTGNVTIAMVGGTMTLADAMTTSAALTISNGTLDAATYDVTASAISFAASTTAKLGTGIWKVTSTGSVWTVTTTTTVTPGTSTIEVSNLTATSKTFTGAGKTFATVKWSGQNITVINNNTFTTMAFANATTSTASTVGVKFTGTSTTTLTTSLTCNGSAGVLCIATSTAATTWEIKKTGGGTVCTDFMKLSQSLATPGSTFYAGTGSTDVMQNSGWTFTACPAVGTSNPRAIFSGSVIFEGNAYIGN